MGRARGIALIVALACLGAFLSSVISLAGRIQRFNAGSGRTLFTFREVPDRAFEFAGHAVSLTDEEKPGQNVVVVRYGERELRLLAPDSVKIGRPELPGLLRHADWLRVLRFQPYSSKGGQDRLAIVTKRSISAADPRTGQVWNRDWVFDFNEFLPDGSFAAQALRYPKTKGDKDPKAGELREGTWEKDAAGFLLRTTPPDSLNFGRPTAAFKDDAIRVSGWTLPGAVVSGLGLLASLAVLFGPRRLRGD